MRAGANFVDQSSEKYNDEYRAVEYSKDPEFERMKEELKLI